VLRAFAVCVALASSFSVCLSDVMHRIQYELQNKYRQSNNSLGLEKQWLSKPLFCTHHSIGMFCKEM
jgi:hypothetical protein